MGRIEGLRQRRYDANLRLSMAAPEVYDRISQTESVRYAIGAMQPIDAGYTQHTREQGRRIENQLSTGVPTKCEFRFQGSVTNDTHIKARSDIDLLVIIKRFHWRKPPLQMLSRYSGDEKADMRMLRQECETVLRNGFPAASLNATGAKALSIEGGSLTRKVDVVPASWVDTVESEAGQGEAFRGVKVFDSHSVTFVENFPFLHNRAIDEKDARVFGGLRKAIRLMKSLMYDSRNVDMSSYDIAAIAWNMADGLFPGNNAYDLVLVEACYLHCALLCSDAAMRESIKVPNQTRAVFGADGATLSQLQALTKELDQLRTDILTENARSFRKLYDARVEY